MDDEDDEASQRPDDTPEYAFKSDRDTGLHLGDLKNHRLMITGMDMGQAAPSDLLCGRCEERVEGVLGDTGIEGYTCGCEEPPRAYRIPAQEE